MSKVLRGEFLDGEIRDWVKRMALKLHPTPHLINDQVRMGFFGSCHAHQRQSYRTIAEASIQLRLIQDVEVEKGSVV